MPLYITKVINADSNTTYQYLESEHVWGTRKTANYTFSILDVRFENGTDSLLEGIEALQEAYARPNIAAKIGIDEFKNGNVLSLSLPESERVRTTTASISVEEFTRVEDDGVLSDIASFVPSPQDIQSISEDLSFSRSEGQYSYNRSVSLSYTQDAGGDFLNKAKVFLKNLFLNNRPDYGYLTDGISEYGKANSGLKPFVTESYDEINKEIGYSESLSSSRIVRDGVSFSKEETFRVNLTPEGYTEKNYNLSISALQNPLETVLNSGIEISLQSLIDQNTGTYGTPISIERTLNADGGNGSLKVSFTNDPRKNQQTNALYQVSEKGGEPFSSFTFSTTIKTRGFNRETAFIASKDYLKTNKDQGYEKIENLFPEANTGELNEVSRSVSYDPFQREASQRVTYSTDPAYAENGDGILSRKISVSDNKQVNRHEILPVYGYQEIGIENTNGKTIGRRSVSVDVISTDPDLLNQAFQIASGELPPYNYYYMTSKQSTEQPNQNSVSANLDFLFFD